MTAATLALHQRLLFDTQAGEVRDGPRRYLVMRADVLMGAFDRLPPLARHHALQCLADSVHESGGDSVRAYLRETGRESLLDMMAQASRSLGWGQWRFEAADHALRLHVRNSPFAAATTVRDGPACHAIAGMLRAVATALWEASAEVREIRCSCQFPAASTECLFEATNSSLLP